MKNNKHNVNPEGHNQWILRGNDDIQKIINLKASFWTKKTFRNKKILTRKETERQGLIFGHHGNKLPLSKIFKHSTDQSIDDFKTKNISDKTLRKRYKSKRYRDLMPLNKKKKHYKERHRKLTEEQLIKKRKRDKEYYYRNK